jgi:hypothetical protein
MYQPLIIKFCNLNYSLCSLVYYVKNKHHLPTFSVICIIFYNEDVDDNEHANIPEDLTYMAYHAYNL